MAAPAVARIPAFVRDALLVAVLCGATLPATAGEPVPVALSSALLLPLLWRRRAPLPVFCAVAAAAFVQWLAGCQLPADAALLIALATVAAHTAGREVLVACAVLEGGILLACHSWAEEGRFVSSAVALNALAAAAALLGAYTRALRERTVHLERERDQRARLAVAGERSRIAREMHDIVTHNLSVMVALADAAGYAPPDEDLARPALEQISGTGRQALADMRRALGVLRADTAETESQPLPGIARLEVLAEQMRAAGLPTALEVLGDRSRVPAAAQLTVYRLVQEALTNTLRHTPHGTRARVRVVCLAEGVTVDVVDDGPGGRSTGPAPGHGIAGMRERAAAHGGRLLAGPLPDGGWHVGARLGPGDGTAGGLRR
ncbi:sensor histidine kinase [Streptomyces sp. PsTaAH-124]|uniref:sensor histidine kinase n=1 Tax=Streptomyces sp. PsTaAH-124 TaxID=1157638 RepID=UPI000381AD6F|nr:sensor histidine kinase [Streptomyces sp. PsTaAH-124]